MRTSEVKPGMQVRRISDTFVADKQEFTKATRRIGIVRTEPFLGTPVPGKNRSTLRKVTVQWQGTTLSEDIYVHRLEPVIHEVHTPQADRTSQSL